MIEENPRLQWPDVAKGVCILLVVLHHVTTKDYLPLIARLDPDHDVLANAWNWLTNGLKPIRMPLFFAISGLFAASAVRRPWGVNARRVVGGYYLYVVWLLVYLVLYRFETTMVANRTTGAGDLVRDLLWASTSMWFLYALVAYFVIVKLLRRVPPGWVVGVSAVLTASLSWSGVDETNRLSVLAHFTYFALGALCPGLMRSWAARRHRLLVTGVIFAALSALLGLGGVPLSIRLLVLSTIGVPFGVGLAARLSQTVAAVPLAWLGRRTLRVYVLHLAVLAAWVHVPWQQAGLDPVVGVDPVTATLLTFYPLLVTALVVAWVPTRC